MISGFMGLSPVLGSVLTAQSLEPALDSVSPSLPLPSLSKINIKKKKKLRSFIDYLINMLKNTK